MDPTFLTAAQLADLTRTRQIGRLELLDHYIARVERLDPKINAVAGTISTEGDIVPAN